MSAIPIFATEGAEPRGYDYSLSGTEWSTHEIQVVLIHKLQDHARGVSRKRRAVLHMQFSQEWRQFIDCGGLMGHRGQLPSAEYPLLGILYNQALGTGEPVLLS